MKTWKKNHKGIMKTHFSQKSLKIYIIHLYVWSIGIEEKWQTPSNLWFTILTHLGQKPSITTTNQHLRIWSQNKELLLTVTFIRMFFLVSLESIETTTIRRNRNFTLLGSLLDIPSSRSMIRTITNKFRNNYLRHI